MDLHQQNINSLLLNSGFIENIGLLNGKMGIAIWSIQFNFLNFNCGENLRSSEIADLLNQQGLLKGIAGPLLLHCISNPILDFRITPDKKKGQEALPSERPTLSAPAPSVNSDNYR